MKRVVGVVALLAALGLASPLRAQDSCDALILRALNEFETSRRIQLLVDALNPGPPCAGWPVAVLALAQTLVEDGRDSVAAVWLRWAARRDRDLQPDTLQVLPKVVEAYRAARAYVNRSRNVGDSLAATTWLWPGSGAGEGTGRIQVSGAVPSLRVEVTGVGLIGPGSSVPVTPGSYELAVSAPGFDSLRVTREVLPGVATVIDFRPRAASVQVARATPPVPTPPQSTRAVQQPQKRKFPLLLVVGGAAAAVAVVALVAGGPDDPTTGDITFTFPSPP